MTATTPTTPTTPTHYTVSGSGPKIIVAFATLASLTTIVIALRIYVRGWMVKSFGIDDWTAIFGWVAYVSLTSTAIAAAHHGFGQHANLIQPHLEIETGLRLAWVSELFYATSNMAVKISICFALSRFVLEKSHKILLYVVAASTSISNILLFFMLIFQCTPVSFFWKRSQENTYGKCLNPIILVIGIYIYSVISVICDWSMAILPWILVRKLRMSVREKILLVFVLAMGSIASVLSIGRLAYLNRLSRTNDLLYETTGIVIWSACETGLGLFASCAATLRPLLKHSCIRRRHAEVRQEPIHLPDVVSPSRKVKRPRLPWSELLDSNTEYTLDPQSSLSSAMRGPSTTTDLKITQAADMSSLWNTNSRSQERSADIR